MSGRRIRREALLRAASNKDIRANMAIHLGLVWEDSWLSATLLFL
jgi:hypothetical protein